MGLRTWIQGHGWDGTRETTAEQHTRAMHAQVEAWKVKDAEARQEPSTPATLISPKDIQQVRTAFAQDMEAVRRVLYVHQNEYGHRREMDSGYRPQTPIVDQVAHVLNVYHARGIGEVTEKMRDHGQARQAWVREARLDAAHERAQTMLDRLKELTQGPSPAHNLKHGPRDTHHGLER